MFKQNNTLARLAARAYERLGSTDAIRQDLIRQEEFARGLAAAIRTQREPDVQRELGVELEWAHLLIAEDRAALAGVSEHVNLFVTSPVAHRSFGKVRTGQPARHLS
jgi:hypothetical protein